MMKNASELFLKMVVNYELLMRAVFSCFHGQIFFLKITLSGIKSCLILKGKRILKNLGSIFWGC